MAKIVLRSRVRRKKLQPKPKQETKSWQTRNEGRKGKQEAYTNGVIVIAPDIDGSDGTSSIS